MQPLRIGKVLAAQVPGVGGAAPKVVGLASRTPFRRIKDFSIADVINGRTPAPDGVLFHGSRKLPPDLFKKGMSPEVQPLPKDTPEKLMLDELDAHRDGLVTRSPFIAYSSDPAVARAFAGDDGQIAVIDGELAEEEGVRLYDPDALGDPSKRLYQEKETSAADLVPGRAIIGAAQLRTIGERQGAVSAARNPGYGLTPIESTPSTPSSAKPGDGK